MVVIVPFRQVPVRGRPDKIQYPVHALSSLFQVFYEPVPSNERTMVPLLSSKIP